MKRVVIIGGGVTGLTAAYELGKRGIPAVVLEAAGRPGGVIQTACCGSYVIEGGPDSLLTTKPWGAALCRELGIELAPVQTRQVHVLAGGRLVPLPEGLTMTVPARLGPFLRSPLISPLGKLRMALDLVLPRRCREDESLGTFMRRRLGQEALTKIAEPLLGSVYLAEADQLGLRATYPRLLDMEREHRSLILAARAITPPTGPLFQAPRRGMGEIVERLAAQVDVRCNERVVCMVPGFRVMTLGAEYEATDVLLATPAHVAAGLLGRVAPEPAELLRTIPYVPSANVSLGFAGATTPSGSGFVVPRAEGRPIVACTFASQKYPDRAPPGNVLLRWFMRSEASVDVARAESTAILGIHAEPAIARSFTWQASSPIYTVGHGPRVAEIMDRLPPGLHLAGAGYHGVGVPDCIRDAQRAVDRIASRC